LTDEIADYGRLYDEDSETPEYKLEALALRISHTIGCVLDARSMKRTDLAKELGVSAPMVTKILSGRSNFTLKTLVGLADALDCDFDLVFKPRDYAVTNEWISLPMLLEPWPVPSVATSRLITMDLDGLSFPKTDWMPEVQPCDSDQLQAA
jgi:transcriptional regulator with XRE-family HTH domain